MADDFYNAPGAAAGNAIQTFMVQRQMQQHQDLMDRLAVTREARLGKSDDLDLEIRRLALEEKKQEAAEKVNEKARAAHMTDLGTMMPGDIPSAAMVEDSKKFHTEHLIQNPKQGLADFVKTLPAGSPEQQGVQAQMTGPMRVFAGMPKQREQAAKDAKIKAIVDQLPTTTPGTPEFARLAMQYEMETGKTIPAGMMKAPTPPKPETQAMMRQNPRGNGPPERMVDGQWVPWTFDVPKEAHWETQLPPRDTSAHDAARTNQFNTAHQQATTRIDKMQSPYEEQEKSLRTLSTSLAQKGNPQADALISIELLKSTVAGNGVRLTQPEINALGPGARTKWENLQLTLNAWGGDRTKPLVLTEEQKTDIRKLAVELRKSVRGRLTKFNAARDAVDSAKSPEEIYHHVTGLHKALGDDETDTDTPTPAAPTVDDLIKKARGDQ